jgi:uridylate kinase
MTDKKTVLLKLTGEILTDENGKLSKDKICIIADQIKELSREFYFGIVVGGGNFFRGRVQGKALHLSSNIGHQIGMLATMMNGLIIEDIFDQHDLPATLFCAVPTPEVGKPISAQGLQKAQHKDQIAIFTGGTGNPFFTTDTTAILRGLQINADVVWKGTSVDGVYSADPHKDNGAVYIPKITYEQALEQNLKIMDATAFALAKEHHLPIRIFNLFTPDALIKAARDKNFGSLITSN